MKEGVRWPTFPYDEYRLRIDRAKKHLSNRDIDAMILFSPTNWHYYGGFTDTMQMHNYVWRSCLIARADADPVAVVHLAFFWDIANRSYLEDVRYWADHENHPLYKIPISGSQFYDLFFDTLNELGLANKRLGFETGTEIHTYLSFQELEMIRAKLPEAKITSADPAIWDSRMIKTAWEQEVIREGARLACECVRAAFESIRPGINELDMHRTFWTKAAELGIIEAPTKGTWACFSTRPDDPTGVMRWIMPPVDRVIQPGDQGCSDGGLMYKGYQYDFQRTFHVGKPSREMQDYHKIATASHLATIETMKPGVPLRELFETSLRVLNTGGYPYQHIISFIGHGEGLDHHEPPWITATEETALQPGMVLAIEIGAFHPEGAAFGAMPEDLILVTETGRENLTAYLPHDIWVAG